VTVSDVDGTSTLSATLHVVVSDAQAAESRMQRVLLTDDSLVVKGFRRQTASLEDVFVSLVEGTRDDG
jgi:hypothetical protein